MKGTIGYYCLLGLALTWVGQNAIASEPWKGAPRETDWNLGILASGVSLSPATSSSNTYVNRFAPVAALSRKLIHQGFLPEINNQVYLDLQFGPVIKHSDGSAYFYSLNSRWDLQRDERLTFYVLLGLGGTPNSDSTGSSFNVEVREGLGLFYRPLSGPLGLRTEFSTKFAALGLNWDF